MDALIKEHPDQAAVRTHMGRLLVVQGDRAGARREFDRAIQLDAGSTEALEGRVRLDLADKTPSRARAVLGPALQKSPNQPALLFLLASTYAAEGNAKDEEAALRKIIELDARNIQGYISLAGLYVRQGKLDQARAEYEAMLTRQPRDFVAQTMVGIILETQGRADEAQKAYEQAVASAPRAAVAANNLAWLYAERGGNLDTALQLAQSARQQIQGSASVDDTLGWVYLKKGMAASAIPPLESAVKIDPANATYRYHLGLAYAKSGDKVKADDAFAEAIKRKPGFRDAEEARRALN